MAKKDRIYNDGVCLSRVAFVAEAAIKISASALSNPSFNYASDESVIRYSLDAAEALWDEICSRFPSDEDEVDE